MKVTILGFSVLNGLVENFSGPSGSVDFSIRALGGNHFEVYPYLIDNILETDKPDIVLLDMVSTPRVPRWTPACFRDSVEYIVHRCQQHGAKAGFLNLYRSEIDQSQDFLHGITNQLAARTGAPVLDSVRIHGERGEDLSLLYPDGNHPSETGRKVLGNMIRNFALREEWPDQQYVACPDIFLKRRPTAIIPGGDISFERFGFDENLLSLPAGQPVEIELPEDFVISGAILLMGPRTGSVQFRYADQRHQRMLFDGFCYYPRLRHVHLGATAATSVAVTQSAELPDIPLKKGEPDMSERQGGLFACLGTVLNEA